MQVTLAGFAWSWRAPRHTLQQHQSGAGSLVDIGTDRHQQSGIIVDHTQLEAENGHQHERGQIVRTMPFRVASFLIVGSLLAAAPSAAFARAQKTALSGDQHAVVSGPPASVQRAGKWTIVTNAPLTGTFAFSGDGVSLAGTLSRVVNVKIDSGNNGILWGTVNYVDSQTGVTCAGFNHGKLINNFLTGTLVASCSDGSVLRGTLQDTDITYDAHGVLSAVTTHFTGTILRPNG